MLKKEDSLEFLAELEALNRTPSKKKELSGSTGSNFLEAGQTETNLLKSLKTGEFDSKAKASLEKIRKIFGESHLESRQMIEALRMDLLKKEISVSD